MKRYIKLFWHGLTGILASVAAWITVVLGMKDDSKYGKFIRRVVGSCFAALVLLFTLNVLWSVVDRAWRVADCEWFKSKTINWYNNQELSSLITYHEDDYGNNGYLFNQNNKKVLKGISWIAKPLGEDSLVCFSNGKKRGYFNLYTGEVVIKPIFSHAWIFSDGLASVDDNGWIKFIDHTGKIVIDNHIPYRPYKDGYVFHNGHCTVHNEKGDKLGLIDKSGQWALQPEYSAIEPSGSFWIVSKGEEMSVLNVDLEKVIPFMKAKLRIGGDKIEATMADHTIRTYSLNGEISENFYISEVAQLLYDTNEVFYRTTKTYDDEGNTSSETDYGEAYTRSSVARCLRYQAEYNWYGLMTQEGRIITPPSYSEIIAISPDLYLCKTDYEHGVIIDGKGNRVN